jgi:hypothetical protein
MESVTVENYLKAIYQVSDASGGAPNGTSLTVLLSVLPLAVEKR